MLLQGFLWKLPVNSFSKLGRLYHPKPYCGTRQSLSCASVMLNNYCSMVQEDKKSEFVHVYKFSKITLVRAVCRLKMYQTFFTCLAVPISYISYMDGSISSLTAYAIIGSNMLALAMFIVMGNLGSRVVGFIYANEVGQLKISHLNFWGKREDFVTDKADVVGVIQNPTKWSFHLSRLYFYSKHNISFFVSLKPINIPEKKRDELKEILGYS